MSFFPPDPEMPEPDDEGESSTPRWWGAPEDELPALAPISELLASTEHVAIALIGVAVYREGVEFRLERRLRRRGLTSREWQELCGTFMEHHSWGGPPDTDSRLKVGLVLGDGEKVLENLPHFGGDDPTAEPQGHVLTRRSGGGGGGSGFYAGSDSLWLWPSPPAGPIEFVLQWTALGIPEQRTILDGAELASAAERSQPFWP
ncbi:hypothetical protein [Microbacterium sp. CIAB417]|uniref:hypothetical protein n=1 Tax=Microbacterium sp. CIAB417 TaxID=2860287 RepID=UPI001FAC0821|nr:hypothetical protein [Microbacterium sp. CIAB417]